MAFKPRKENPVSETEVKPFPATLRKLMEETNTTQDKLGKAIGVTRQSVSLYMQGQSLPDCDGLAAIADFFNVSADFLLGRTDIKTQDSDLQMVCNYLGLSERAIGKIKFASSKVYGDTANQFFESGTLTRVISCLSLIQYETQDGYDYELSPLLPEIMPLDMRLEDCGNKINDCGKALETLGYLQFSLSKAISEVSNRMYNADTLYNKLQQQKDDALAMQLKLQKEAQNGKHNEN